MARAVRDRRWDDDPGGAPRGRRDPGRLGAGSAAGAVVVGVGVAVSDETDSGTRSGAGIGSTAGAEVGIDDCTPVSDGSGSALRVPSTIPVPTASATTTAPVPSSIRPRFPLTAAGSRADRPVAAVGEVIGPTAEGGRRSGSAPVEVPVARPARRRCTRPSPG